MASRRVPSASAFGRWTRWRVASRDPRHHAGKAGWSRLAAARSRRRARVSGAWGAFGASGPDGGCSMPLGTSIVVSWSMIRPPPPPPRSCVKGAKRVRTAGRNADGAGRGWGEEEGIDAPAILPRRPRRRGNNRAREYASSWRAHECRRGFKDRFSRTDIGQIRLNCFVAKTSLL